MSWIIPFTLASLVSFIICLVGTKFLISYLAKRNILDTPNQRSNHKNPVPRGGGIAIIGTILLMFGTAAAHHSYIISEFYPILICPLILSIISFADDIKPLPARWRLLAQIAVVTFSIFVLFDGKLLFHGLLPQWLDKLAIGLIWLWFINLFNFMDGIDGITGSQTIAICIGIIGIIILNDEPKQLAFFSIIIASATLGFLWWNWHPAKIFMGDVGSIPLGFLLGWLLLDLSITNPVAALIIPLYYLADSGYTITKRLLKGEKIWLAHSQHFYQIAVRSGHSHAHVVLQITFTNIILIAIAWWVVLNPQYEIIALAVSAILVAFLLYRLKLKTK